MRTFLGLKKKKVEEESQKEVTFLKRRGTSLFLDVGANTGQTGLGLRAAGWEGKIISFEPLRDCFAQLTAEAEADGNWKALNFAIGDRDGLTEIGVSRNRVSSSIRKASDLLLTIFEPVTYESTDEVKIAKLDSITQGMFLETDVVHLKIDTQGYEREVITGAIETLRHIDSVRMEVAVSEVYEGEMTIPEAIILMKSLGFLLVDIWSGWRHPRTKEVLYFDLLFRKGHVVP
ncbi:hypothetical protein ASF91_06490 [Rhizobium sp. Leaf155]|nr:hypothetical protein ASF91_06490 [Rhizobium sp. Leaf155]